MDIPMNVLSKLDFNNDRLIIYDAINDPTITSIKKAMHKNYKLTQKSNQVSRMDERDSYEICCYNEEALIDEIKESLYHSTPKIYYKLYIPHTT